MTESSEHRAGFRLWIRLGVGLLSIMRFVMLSALSWVGVVAALAAADEGLHCVEGPDVEAIQSQRAAFNRAIVEKDMTAIASVLSDDVLLITGSDSDIYRGREAQIDLWIRDFANPDRLIYVRTPHCIDRSSEFPIALEFGHWRGVPANDPETGAAFSGRYSAKWRLRGEVWQLETETYMTDRQN